MRIPPCHVKPCDGSDNDDGIPFSIGGLSDAKSRCSVPGVFERKALAVRFTLHSFVCVIEGNGVGWKGREGKMWGAYLIICKIERGKGARCVRALLYEVYTGAGS